MSLPTGIDLVKLEKKLSVYQGEDKIVSSEELTKLENQSPSKIFRFQVWIGCLMGLSLANL